MGLGPIPMMAMLEYCEINGVEGELREDFLYFTQLLDHKYLEWSAARAKSK